MGEQILYWHTFGYYGDRVAVPDAADISYPTIKLDRMQALRAAIEKVQ